ncbi:hypothetical protein ACFFLM_08310 [Deinococcus oregonensis]|uniref:Lipoprotein n=1 Tax=Deinococcus oregonensis TaxID=1805970 RepID=A0ABV6AZ99_9DEIO
MTPPSVAGRVTMPGTTVSINVPSGFIPMPTDILQLQYSRGGVPPTQGYSTPGPNWEVNIASALRKVALPKSDVLSVQKSLENSVNITPGFRWVKRGIERVGGRDWIVLQFWVNEVDTPIYNHLRVSAEGQQTLVGTANVTKKLYAKYAPQLDAAMRSLKQHG